MRKIKIRAWGAHERRMITYFDSNFKLSVDSETGAIFAGYMIDGERINYTLMQSTGRYDINGREIYEGDIVTFTYTYNDFKYTAIGAIEYENGSFVINWKTGGAYLSDIIPINRIKIIGNIYENPELIEK